MDILNLIFTAVSSYLIGAVPTAFIFGKFLKGIDIRQHGSGNVGATNVFRVLGKGPGIAVLFIDILKGIIPVVFFASFFHQGLNGRIIAAVMAVSGHNWTCFLKFKGGKGIATTLGVLIGLTLAIPGIRMAVSLCVLAWLMCFFVTAYVSVSSIFASVLLPVLLIVLGADFNMIVLGAVLCFFVIFRHRPNIQRLIQGNENKVPLPFHKSSAVSSSKKK